MHQSGKAKRALKDVVASANPDTSIEAIRPLCPTKWTVRVAALQTVMKQLGCILEAMDEIYDDRGDISAKAKGLYTIGCCGRFGRGASLYRHRSQLF